MIFKKPLWQRPIIMLLLILIAVGGGVWLAKDKPMPEDWFGGRGAPEVRMPAFMRSNTQDRLFCAESPETGNCRCITESGQRPEISDAECRRRARQSVTGED